MSRRNVIAQAHSLRGPAGSGFHGGRLPRERVEVCVRHEAILHRGACIECAEEANRATQGRVVHQGPHRILTTVEPVGPAPVVVSIPVCTPTPEAP